MARSLQCIDFDPQTGRVIGQDIRLDSRGILATVNGLEETRERVTAALQFQRGENPYDTTYGLDYAGLGSRPAAERQLLTGVVQEYIRARQHGVVMRMVNRRMLSSTKSVTSASITCSRARMYSCTTPVSS